MSIGLGGEVVLPRRSLRQPNPSLHPSGDCGGCALGGAIGLSVSEVYAAFDSRGITHIGEMGRCLRCSVSDGLADRMLDLHPEWPQGAWQSFGQPAYLVDLAWFNYVRLAIDAGYYGLAKVDFSGNGGPDTNHWVLICGARTEGAVLNKVMTGEVLVSCSVRGEQWYEARDFLRRLGGYDVLLVRPRESKNQSRVREL